MKYWIIKNKGICQLIDENTGIRFLNQEKVNITPDEKIREICDKKKIEEVIDRIEFTHTIQAPNQNVRKEFYEEAMSKYDELEWVKVIKTAYIQKKIKKIYEFEKYYCQEATEYLYSEIAILLEIPYENVENYITQYIQNNSWS